MTTLDIILPAYNPVPGWEEIVVNRFHSLSAQFATIEMRLIIINDGSTKLNATRSAEWIKTEISNFHWISYSDNKGKGYALRKGVEASTSEIIIYTDIDWPYTEQSMKEVIRELANTDVVIGVRDESYYQKLPASRMIISKVLRFFNRKFLRLIADDTQAGLKGFRKHVKHVFLRTSIDRYLFDLEFIHLLSKEKSLLIKTMPVFLQEGIMFSKMKREFLMREARNFFIIWLKS